MTRFNLTTLEGHEAYLNHGDSERVRLKEEGMGECKISCQGDYRRCSDLGDCAMKKNTEIDYAHARVHGYGNLVDEIESLSTTLKDLEEKAEALEFILKNGTYSDGHIRVYINQYAPIYLQKRLGKEG